MVLFTIQTAALTMIIVFQGMEVVIQFSKDIATSSKRRLVDPVITK